MPERRQHPADSDSIELIGHKQDIVLEKLLDLCVSVGTLTAKVDTLTPIAEEGLALGKQAVQHSNSTRVLLSSHITEFAKKIEPWKLLATKLEAEQNRKDAWILVRRVVCSRTAKFFAIVITISGAAITITDGWGHFRTFWRNL